MINTVGYGFVLAHVVAQVQVQSRCRERDGFNRNCGLVKRERQCERDKSDEDVSDESG